ncbi:Transposase and inactivated derivatives, IS1 family [Rhizobiales bacterium GAS113]|nr:Transposase and inactivated derivatives, IS1 family [Rhizobiales bacterium GAS113]
MQNRSRIMASMNKLDKTERARILHLLCEGNSIRAITRLTGVSKTTVTKLVVDAGTAASWYQDRVFQNLACKRLQVDEIWGFVGSKAKNTSDADKAARTAGDVWLWMATDADTKLVPCWHVGGRDAGAANEFIDDLASRLANRVQITTDGHRPYVEAIDWAFGGEVDYAMLVKLYGPAPEGQRRYSPAECVGARKQPIQGNPDMEAVSTSYAERNNLNVRMHSRRMTRLTNAFSKKVENHAHAMALHFLYYNFVRIHKTLKVTPAMAAGVTNRLWEVADMVKVLEAWEAT